MTHVIAIGNLKGGVAKTTTCLSLGACLAEMGKAVLLIDLDPQASLTLGVGLKPDALFHVVDAALLGAASLVSVSRPCAVFGLDIVPANQALAGMDEILYGRAGYEFYLKNSIETMGPGRYDFVLIDCPPSTSALTINALTAADMLIVPVQCEYFSAQAFRQVMDLVKRVRTKSNPRLTYRALVTMYDRRNKINQVIYEQMQRGLNGVLFKTMIEIDARLKESPVFGQPVTVYAPKTRGAAQYRALAHELAGLAIWPT